MNILINDTEIDWGSVSKVFYGDIIANAIANDIKVPEDPTVTVDGKEFVPGDEMDATDGLNFTIS